jgi:non-specific serine/threonine protein kinase
MLKAKDHTGADRSKNKADLKGFDLIITTYGILLRDISFLREQDFSYAILDESQSIKNPNSKRFKAVRMLKAENRLVLIGTPIENNTFDLYAQMTFINPGLLGNMTNFQKEYAGPIDKDKNAMIADELRKLISPFLMRRTKEQVATELPTKTEQVLNCKMGKAQQKVYDAYRNKYRDYLMGKIEEEGVGKSKMYVLEGLTKLRQICDSPKLLSDGEGLTEESVKIDELITQIKERTGNHKLLVFSQFVKMLQLIKIRLEEEKIPFEYLDGSTKNRQERVENFQENEKIRVFLISLKAGGTGLNLTAADYVYIVDPWWNPAVEAQAIDRCYRIGQDKKVMAYKMICQGTIEEKILDMQAHKKQLSADIVQTDESFVKSLTKDSIAALFGG